MSICYSFVDPCFIPRNVRVDGSLVHDTWGQALSIHWAIFRISAVARSFILITYFAQDFFIMPIDDSIHAWHGTVADFDIIFVEEFVKFMALGKVLFDQF